MIKKKSKEKNHISTLQNFHILPEPGQDPTFQSGNSFINPTSASRAGGEQEAGAGWQGQGGTSSSREDGASGGNVNSVSPFPCHFAGSRRLRSPRLISVRRAEGEKELAAVTCRAACVVRFVMPSSPLPF